MKVHEDIVLALSQRAVSFLKNDMGILEVSEDICINQENIFKPKDHMAVIGLGGVINGLVIFGFSDSLMQKLIGAFVYGEVSANEKEELMGEIPAEVANTIIGNAIPNFPNSGKGVTITPPLVMEDSKVALKFKNSKVSSCTINVEADDMLCALLY